MKIQYILILLLLNSTLNAQKNNSSKETPPKIGAYQDKDMLVYKNAIAVADLEVATHALHNIVAANPNGAIYKDTLALAYLQRNMFQQARFITQSLYKEKENDFRLEILAICAKQLNQPTEAIDFYKKLYTHTKKQDFAFEQLQLEYSIKRLAEAKLTAETLISSIPTDDKTELTVAKSDNKTGQKITFKAGIYYLLGKIYADLNDTKSALEALQNALKLNPDYEMAQAAVSNLSKSINDDTKNKK